jgi:hypothetical protein
MHQRYRTEKYYRVFRLETVRNTIPLHDIYCMVLVTSTLEYQDMNRFERTKYFSTSVLRTVVRCTSTYYKI